MSLVLTPLPPPQVRVCSATNVTWASGRCATPPKSRVRRASSASSGSGRQVREAWSEASVAPVLPLQRHFLCSSPAASFVNIIKKGCLAEAECNKTVNVNFPPNSTLYTMTETCCTTDLCNAAPGLPGGSGLGVALATAAALFLTRVVG